MDKDRIEVVLKRKAYEDSPVKVMEFVNLGDAVAKGDNYLSTIERFKAKVLLGSGRVKTVSLIVKNQHESKELRKFTNDMGAFIKEICMYRDVFPKMEAILEDCQDAEGIFWARCYDIRLYDRLVFEDLLASGYKMANRKEQLGLEAATLAIKCLAKFHALSRVLLDRGEIPMDVFKEHGWLKDLESAKASIVTSMTQLTEAVAGWGDEWKEAAERLSAANPLVGQRFVDALATDSQEFTTLCHADFWTNNMLFHGEDLEHPTSVKIVDLQMCYVTAPVNDLLFFLFTSVRLETRGNHLKTLFQVYQASLERFLVKFGYLGVIPTLNDVEEAYNKRAVMQLLNCSVLNWIMREEQVSKEEEKYYKEDMRTDRKGTPTFNPYSSLNATGKKIVCDAVRKAMEAQVI